MDSEGEMFTTRNDSIKQGWNEKDGVDSGNFF
jgi:hypothetical protein